MAISVTDEQRRRNRSTALVLALVAVVFFVAFVIAVDARNEWQFFGGLIG